MAGGWHAQLLGEQVQLMAGRKATPTMAIIDSHSVKAAEEVARAARGYDAAKKWLRQSHADRGRESSPLRPMACHPIAISVGSSTRSLPHPSPPLLLQLAARRQLAGHGRLATIRGVSHSAVS